MANIYRGKSIDECHKLIFLVLSIPCAILYKTNCCTPTWLYIGVLGVFIGLWLSKTIYTNYYEVHEEPPQVLFFPDQKQPCNSFYNKLMDVSERYQVCRRSYCTFAHPYDHPPSSLIQLFLALNTAKKQIDICMYILTHKHLADFLKHLKRSRGIKVRLITDCGKSGLEQNEQNVRIGDLAQSLAEAGLQVRTNEEGSGALMHNKFVIIDKTKLLTGSFNWTNNAVTRNDEAIIIMSYEDVTRKFVEKFEKLWMRSRVSF